MNLVLSVIGGALGALGVIAYRTSRIKPVVVTVQGSLIHESRVEDAVVNAIEKARRRGRHV